MKRLLRNSVTASSQLAECKIKFTATDILQLLMTIEELKGMSIELAQAENGDFMFNIGNSIYKIANKNNCTTT